MPAQVNPRGYTTEWIRRKLKKINPKISIVGVYVNNESPLACRCNLCNLQWNSTWQRLRIGSGCPQCARSALILSQAKVKAVLVKKKVELESTYKGAHVPLKCRCQVCDLKWQTRWASLSQGRGCPQCARKKLSRLNLTPESVIRTKIKLANSKVKMIGAYKGRMVKTDCKCLQCNYVWSVRPSDLLKGSGCPMCQTSRGENLVREVIEELTGKKFPHANPSAVPFLHGLTLDGYCPSLTTEKWIGGVAYERQGQQHYGLVNFGGNLDSKEGFLCRQRRDRRKRMQCWRHRVKLITIPYWVRNEAEVRSYLNKRLQSCNLIGTGAN